MERREVGLERDCSLEARCCLREASFSFIVAEQMADAAEKVVAAVKGGA